VEGFYPLALSSGIEEWVQRLAHIV
jgi:hypothetical protein